VGFYPRLLKFHPYQGDESIYYKKQNVLKSGIPIQIVIDPKLLIGKVKKKLDLNSFPIDAKAQTIQIIMDH
jgi:hypothetical protein